jgi:3-phenylpropionate/trans-cinnamate dioxygenase ferredoxin reductase component
MPSLIHAIACELERKQAPITSFNGPHRIEIMSEEKFEIVIIGGSHAGGEAAFRLRQGGFTGSIALLSAEPYLPYHRPPLSKAYLAGEVTTESLLLRNLASYEKTHISWHPDTIVTAIDRMDHRLTLADGRKLGYGKLIIATGGRPRILPLPGADLDGIHTLRSIADADRLRPEFLPGKKLVIVGAGYIGLEVASVAVKHGLEVEIVEFASRVLARVAGPELSSFYEAIHTKAGVKFRFNTGVEGFVAADHDPTHVGVVRCSGGADLKADLALVAAGLVPNVELAKEAGLEVDNGIVVDEFCRTSDADILAIGDAVEFPLPFLDRKRVRLESVPNAMEHARVAASLLNNKPSPYNVVPWFWSDQYHHKLQSVGLSHGYEQAVIRPPKNPDGFIVFYLKSGLVIAADCVSAMAEFNVAKKLVTEKISVDPAALADPSIDLKSIATAPVA